MPRIKIYPDFVEKTCPTCSKLFQCPHVRRNKQRFCSKTCANHDPDVIAKMIASQKIVHNEKYGGKHPMQTKSTQENFKYAIRKKYGVDYPMQNNVIHNKSKETCRARYGVNTPLESELIKSKSRFTCMKRYGVDNIQKYKPTRDKNSLNKKIKHYYLLKEFCKSINVEQLFSVDDYKGYHFSNLYNFKCNICNNVFESTAYHLNNIFCQVCNPYRKNSLETEVFLYISSILPDTIINRNDRTILVGKEIDIYIPPKKIGIEINGIYWHSEIGGKKDKYYHINKLKNCLFHGVNLIQIFETEWISKKEIVKLILKNHIHPDLDIKNIPIKDCILKELTNNEKNVFLENNHICGKDTSTIKIGLLYNNEIVSVMTFRKKSRFDKNIQWELTRFCDKLNYKIEDSNVKMFTYFVEKYNPILIVSYSDRRYFDGNLYYTMGFKSISNTSPGYFYINKDYKSIKGRMSFQKHRLTKILPNFDPNLTEWENMRNSGFDRIWDCGHTKWLWKRANQVID